MTIRFLLGVSAIALFSVPSVAAAQAASKPAADDQAAVNTDGIAEIVVTASHRAENLQKTAIAVSAAGSEELQSRGVATSTDITKLIPAVKIGFQAGSSVQITIRGVGNFGGNQLAEPGVAVNLDGVYMARASSLAGQFYDLSRVEVLKGPQGTLYGRNSTGGVVNVLTNDPENKFGMEFTGEYGNYGHVRASGAVNVPLIDDVLAIRVSGQAVYSDGVTPDGSGAEDTRAGRLKLKFTPTPNLSVLLEASYAQSQDGPIIGGFEVPGFDPFRDIGTGPTSLQNTGFIAMENAALKAAFGIPAAAPVQLIPQITQGFINNKTTTFQGTVNYDFGPANATLIVGNVKNEINYKHWGAGFLVSDIVNGDPSSYTTAELRFASKSGGPFKWQFGGFYFDDFIHANVGFDQGLTFQSTNIIQKTKSYSGFGEVTYAVVPSVRLTAGGRYTSDEKSFSGTISGPVGGPLAPRLPAPAIAANCPTSVAGVVYNPAPAIDPETGNPFFSGSCTQPASGAKTFGKFTWKLGIDADIGPSSLVYASVATGFKSGGFVTTGDSPKLRNTFEPETLMAYTLGTKNRFFDNKLQLNAEAFYWRYENQQFSHLGVGVAGTDSSGNPIIAGNALRIENAGGADLYGLEIESLFRPTPRDLFRVGVQYQHSKYTALSYTTLYGSGGNPGGAANRSLPNANCKISNVTPVGATNPANAPGTSDGSTFNTAFIDCSGRPVIYSPEWVFNLGYEHTFDLGSSGSIVAAANSAIQTSYFTGQEYLAAEYRSGYSKTDATLTWRSADEHLSITAYVNNIENARVVESAFLYTFAPPGGGVRNAYGRPRTFGGRFNVKF